MAEEKVNIAKETIKGLPEAAKTVFGKIGSFVAEPLRPFGEDIAELIIARDLSGKYDEGELSNEGYAAAMDDLKVLKKSDTQIIGDVAQSVLMATPFRGVQTLNKLSKVAPTLGALVKTGMKTGAKIGGSFGAAMELSEKEKPTVGGIAKTTAIGAGLGTLVGGIGGAIAPYLGKPIGKQVQAKLPKGLPQTFKEVATETKAIQAQAKMQEPGVGKYVLSPELVFKRMGVDAWENVGKPILKTQSALQNKVVLRDNAIKDLQKEVGSGKEISQKLFKWLNNEKKPQLNPKELKTAQKIKEMFDGYADQLDVMRMKEGLPPINRQRNYVTNLINEEIRTVLENKTMDGAVYRTVLDSIPKEVYDPFLLARKNKLPIQEDVWKALRAYTAITERKLAFDPVLKEVNAYLKKLPEDSGVKEYSKWFINDMLGKPSGIETAMVNTTNRFLSTLAKGVEKISFNKFAAEAKVKIPVELADGLLELEEDIPRWAIRRISPLIGKIKMLNYMSFIGSNLRTMFVNLTQPIGVAANLPGNVFRNLTDMAYGYAKMATKIFSKKGWKEMSEKGILQEFSNLMEFEFSTTGALSDLTMWNMRISEFINRVSSTYASKRAFQRELGKFNVKVLEEEAIILGKELSDIVNFKYGTGQTPRIFKNPIGQLYYQYMTFVLKQAELQGNMAAKLPKKNMMADFAKATEKGEGVDWLMTHKAPVRTAFLRYWLYAGALTTALQPFGFQVWDTFSKGFLPNQLTALPDLVKGILEGDAHQIKKSLGSMAAFPAIAKGYKGLIPLREQIKRTNQFLEAIETGEIKDAATGRVIEEVNATEAARRFLLGKSGTIQGQKQYKMFEKIGELRGDYSEHRLEVFNIAIEEHNVGKANRKIREYNKEMLKDLRETLKEGGIQVTSQQLVTLMKMYTLDPINPQNLMEEMRIRKVPALERYLGITK